MEHLIDPSRPVDSIAIFCSDHRLDTHHRVAIRNMGFNPFPMQWPGGPLPLSKSLSDSFAHHRLTAIDHLETALRATGSKTIILISHADCKGYQSGPKDKLNSMARRSFTQNARLRQLADLNEAAAYVKHLFGGELKVSTFYADAPEPHPQHENFTIVAVA